MFIHKVRTTQNQTLLDIEVGDVQFILRNFGITEHMLEHDMDVVGNFVCDKINQLFRKFNQKQMDGIYFQKSAKSVLLCNVNSITNEAANGQKMESNVYINGGEIYPSNLSESSVQKRTQICKNFYQPPRKWVESYPALYRHTLSQMMSKNAQRTDKYGRTVYGKKVGLDPGDVHRDLVSVILASITNALRPYIYKGIQDINKIMSDYGQFIVAGGDAINMLIDPVDRSVSPDIDTKFILLFKQFF